MTGRHATQRRLSLLGLAVTLLTAAWCHRAVPAGEVRLRSGMVITGQPRKLPSLTVKGTSRDPDSPITGYNVVMVESGAARYFVPSKQIPDDGLNRNAGLGSKQESFRIKQERTGGGKLTVASVGQFAEVTPFDKFGRRRITLRTAKEPIHVVQGITEVTPEYVTLTALNHVWEYGVATKSIPVQDLELVLRHRIDPGDAKLRLSLVRFFIQAEMYPQAFQELPAIARDFPDLKDQVTSAHQGLVQEFGRVVLRELKARVESGQYELAEEYARQITPDAIGGAVLKDAQEFLQACDRRRDAMVHVRDLLDGIAAKLTDEASTRPLLELRSTLLEQLHPDTLERLDPFFKAENDAGYTPSEKLALAYSGWVLGAANAVTDLDQAVRLWDARFLIQEAVRAPTQNERQLVYQQLRRVEGIGWDAVRKLIPLIPPVIETPGIEPGTPQALEVPSDDDSPATTYSVLLPIEYSPHHAYPLLIALRAQGKTVEQTLSLWGGSADQPGATQRRGYILISPDYAPADQRDYAYDTATHKHVLAAMNDARRRFTIDSDRIYLTGHGMGADAAFDLGFSHPDEFAGVIPIGGVMDHYCKFYRENAVGTAWYVIGGELDRDTVSRNLPNFDQVFKYNGYKVDFTYCEFAQRGYESYAEEFSRVFEWMNLHRRPALPSEIDVKSLRQTDRTFYWVTAEDLPQTTILPLPPGSKSRIAPMKISARITSGNLLVVSSPSPRHTVWIHPDLIDLEKQVILQINGRKSKQFIDRDFTATIEDFRARGDRQRLYAAKLEF